MSGRMIHRKGLRHTGVPVAGGQGSLFREKAEGIVYEWHAHGEHQLLYCVAGRTILRTGKACWLLPAGRAAWIPAETLHSTTLDRADIISVLFKAKPAWALSGEIRIFHAGPLLREMLLFSDSLTNGAKPPLQKSFLETLALLCREWVRDELPFRLPNSTDPDLEKAIAWTLDHLDTASLEGAAKAGGCSERTFRRRFQPSTGLTWVQYIHQARMLQAMDQLLVTGQSVLEIALSVGYDSPSAFSKAFHLFTGANPLAFRKAGTGGNPCPVAPPRTQRPGRDLTA